MEEQKPKRSLFRSLGLLFVLLVIVPAGSWYFLQTGLNYRLNLFEQLNDLGLYPAEAIKPFGLEQNDLKGKMIVASFFNAQQPGLDVAGDLHNKLYEQFDNREDVIFLMNLTNNQDSLKAAQFLADNELVDEKQCFIKSLAKDELSSLSESFQSLLADQTSMLQEASFIITDTSHNIKNIYNMEREEEVSRMIEHMVMVLPIVKKKRTNNYEEE